MKLLVLSESEELFKKAIKKYPSDLEYVYCSNPVHLSAFDPPTKYIVVGNVGADLLKAAKEKNLKLDILFLESIKKS